MSSSRVSMGRDISFPALDGTQLGGVLFEPEGTPHTCLLMNSGTGIPQRFYARFAQHAAANGFVVLTYDYRGIGLSAPRSLRGYDARYRDWGQRDVPGAINWLTERYPTLPLAAVGHSTGGQQLGLCENVNRIKAALFVGVSTGYWRGMPARMKWLTLGLWKIYIPLASRLCGYAPARAIGLGENLPTGVAREWGSWCMEPEYLAAYFDDVGRRTPVDGAPFGRIFFDEIAFPIRAYCFTDDPIATPSNVAPLLALFKNVTIDTCWVNPADLELKSIGHLGFFRSGIGKSMWDDALNWLREQSTTAVNH